MASIMFEVMEVSLQHLFPTLMSAGGTLELDVFGCNFLGMASGMLLVRYLEQREWDWSGLELAQQVGPLGKMRRIALGLRPSRGQCTSGKCFLPGGGLQYAPWWRFSSPSVSSTHFS